MEVRLADVQQQMAEKLHENSMKAARSMSDLQDRMNDTLHGSSEKTTKSLTQLQERLTTIDRAQTNIEKLSGDVLSLQDILSNKQTRGAFGEIQLNDIVTKALPSDAYTFQATLSNGKRADCLIHLPNPPGPIVIDAKFPLEAYEQLVNAEGKEETARALQLLRQSIRVHIKAISEKYILDGETADGALMFLPSEAVYAELHAKLPDVVREGFDARVWIVSPTTCMATLNTMRAILKDARMREQTGAIRKNLKALHRDVELVVERVGKLDTHFTQARKDLDGIGVAAERAGKRADKLDNFDFEELQAEAAPVVVPLTKA
jgi:DNA recombination protein RmuC